MVTHYFRSIFKTRPRDRPISDNCSGRITPIRLTKRKSEIDLTWKQSATEVLVRPFCFIAGIFTIQGAMSYLAFQSVRGTITFSGSFPD